MFINGFRGAAFRQISRRKRMTLFSRGLLGIAAMGLLFAGCGGGNNSVNTATLPYSGTLERSDVQMRSVINAFLAFKVPPLDTLTPAQARQQPTIADAVKAVLTAQGKSTAPEPVGSVRDTTVPGPASALPVRVYTPTGAGPFPVVVYFHGGGWVIGTIDVYDASCRALTNAAQAVVISVEYRKGPENKFPAAHEDAYAATQYVMNNTALFGGDPARVAVAGESAGGNMAVAVCYLAKQRNGKMPVYQVAVYPVADNDMTRPSYITNENAVPLNKRNLIFFTTNYFNTPADGDSPLISLVDADLTGLPPATVITDEIDPLHDEGAELAQKLTAVGVTVRYQNYTGVTHEFFGTGAVVDKAKDAVAFAAAGLRSVFGPLN